MSEEDALAALKLARKHADAGNHVAALKWARKSLAINATPDARFLVEKLESGAGAAAAGPSGSSTSSAAAPGGEGLRSRAPAAAAAAGSSPAPSARAPPEKQKAREWTPEQAAVVKRVNAAGRAHDYYGVLGLKKEDSPDESAVKKGYRKVRRGRAGGARCGG
ncbi:hypothetical protein FA09DRAFT_250381 [Tilletiopsis washingtonensis]|jgi:DnaJ family protein B protein 12|uniref:Uncharacterized protein n=1 Tax=Tilletiopsis washingtonensis TaxID=58919 RepID=A0A316ZEL7_9BASI|nr:hypothetical protein FA09DRAFT_250381 [Tilletiopsis washingtonensis]PWN98755.1 hypothetical protein FA09DRAFT_250381 [Tilletiopsis washingtonensis]